MTDGRGSRDRVGDATPCGSDDRRPAGEAAPEYGPASRWRLRWWPWLGRAGWLAVLAAALIGHAADGVALRWSAVWVAAAWAPATLVLRWLRDGDAVWRDVLLLVVLAGLVVSWAVVADVGST